MNSKQLRAVISSMYSNLTYQQFCEYMGFNPKYDEKYFRQFQTLANALGAFDDSNLQRILDFDVNWRHTKDYNASRPKEMEAQHD